MSSRVVPSTLLGLALAACSAPKAEGPAKGGPAGAATAAAAARGSDGPNRLPLEHVVATLPDGKITYGEVFNKRRGTFRTLRNNYLKQTFDAERQNLESMIVERQVKAAAAKAGKTEDAWFDSQLQIPEVRNEEILSFYEQRVKPSGQPFESIKDRIVEHLVETKKNEARVALVRRLLAEANATIDLPPPALEKLELDLADRPAKGPETAKVTIVEFSDFQCPYCEKAAGGLEAITKAFPNDVRVVFLHYPLDFHQQAMPAAIASRCAQQQGKFWPFHDKIFAKQRELSADVIQAAAAEVGIEKEAFGTCVIDPKTRAFVQADMEQGEAAGVEGTPTILVNGIPHQGIPTVADIQKLIGT